MATTLDLSELDARTGRLFMAGLPGTRLDEATRSLVRNQGVGGIIFFSRNIESPDQLAALCRELQDLALECQGLPLLLAVDQEGGPVARLRPPFTVPPAGRAIGDDPQPTQQALASARLTAREMKLVGLNMNLAPVLDVGREGAAAVMQDRTFGADPRKVAHLGAIVIDALQQEGVLAVAKHFPGLGGTPADPHAGLPVIETRRDELESVDLPPFKAAIDSRVAGIMTSHAVYTALDPRRPATLSETILTRLLRQELGFQDLILTDDLEMGAIAGSSGVPAGAAIALAAGADLLLVCRDQSLVLESIELIQRLTLTGEIPTGRLLQASERIRRARSRLLQGFRRVSSAAVKHYFSK